MFPINDFNSGVTMWMINVFLRVLFINVWLIVLAILILKIPALNTSYNIALLIVLTVYHGTIFSFYALSLNYSVYQQKIDSKFLEQTRTALYFFPVVIVLYTFNFQGVQLSSQQDLTLKSVSGTLLNVYQTPHLISELKCLQDDCLYLKIAEDEYRVFECAVYDKDGCTFINREYFYPSKANHLADVRIDFLQDTNLAYALQIGNTIKYPQAYFEDKYAQEKQDAKLAIGILLALFLLTPLYLKKMFLLFDALSYGKC